jgi:hypothetical protein
MVGIIAVMDRQVFGVSGNKIKGAEQKKWN